MQICFIIFIISHYENKTALVFNWVNFQIAIKLNQFKWTNLRYLVLLHGLKVLVYYLLEYFNQLFGWLDRLKFGLSFHIWYLCKPRERNNCGKREREKGVVGSHFAKYLSPFSIQVSNSSYGKKLEGVVGNWRYPLSKRKGHRCEGVTDNIFVKKLITFCNLFGL